MKEVAVKAMGERTTEPEKCGLGSWGPAGGRP